MDGGSVVAIARSVKMIEIATRRDAAHFVAGVASSQAASLVQVDLGEARFDKVFAINVGLLCRQRPVRELTILRKHLAPEGRLFLLRAPPPGSTAPLDAGPVLALLEDTGSIVAEILEQNLERTRVECVVAQKGVSV